MTPDEDPTRAREAPWRPGFETQDKEVQGEALEVEGSLPGWLQGTLVRNGPAKFEAGDRELQHWFDGLAMLHAFQVEGGSVTYSNRFLETEAYRHVRDEGELGFPEFATDPCRSLFDRFQSLFDPELTDNASVNVTRLADEYAALTETPMPVRFDPETLEAQGRLEWEDDLEGQLTTAHPHHDPDRGEAVNYVADLGRRSTYRVHAVPDGEARRRTVAEVPVHRPAYMHSFGMTPNYVILAEFPLVVNPLRLALSGDALIENYRWRPDRGTRWIVVHRDAGEVVAEPTGEAMFAFHHVNAYEDGDEVVVDLCAYPDATVLDDQYLDRIRGPEPPRPEAAARPTRVRVPLDGGDVHQEVLADEAVELPRTHYRAVNGEPYRYAYGVGHRHDPPQEFLNQLVKLDVEAGETWTWTEERTYPGEPVFVPRPDGQAEDDGLVLSVVFDAEADTSFLLALEADTFEEAARAETPHRVPFGFHGSFFGGV